MADDEFVIEATNESTGEQNTFLLKQQSNVLHILDRPSKSWLKFGKVELSELGNIGTLASYLENRPDYNHVFSPETPGTKDLSKVVQFEVQLGLSCNYSCSYCSEYESRSEGRKEVSNAVLLKNVEIAIDPARSPELKEISFFGGEPYLYFEAMRRIVELANRVRPGLVFSVVTNGSLWNKEKVEWTKEYISNLIISHDGPGQKARHNFDYLDDDEYKKFFIELFDYFKATKKNIKFNPIITSANRFNRTEIVEYFREKMGFTPRFFSGFGLDHHGDHTFEYVLTDSREAQSMAREHFDHITKNDTSMFPKIQTKLKVLHALLSRNISVYKTTEIHCRAFDKKTITMDRSGDFVSCGSVSASSKSDAGIVHKLGNVRDIGTYPVGDGYSALNYERCRYCPVLSICQGGCYYTLGEKREINCFKKWYEYFPLWAAVFYSMTGHVVTRINNKHFPEYMGDVFGNHANEYPPKVFKKKVISIKPIA